MIVSIKIIEKRNLQSKRIRKCLGTTKDMFLLSMVPLDVGLQEKRMIYIIIKTRVFVQLDQRECAQSHLRYADMDMHSIIDAYTRA